MTIYIDSNFKCYADAAESRQAVETDFFDGKCKTFIEGYRFVPSGETWTREDGQQFTGEMVSPFGDLRLMAAAQAQYEADEAAHAVELAALVEIIYESDMEVIG